MLVTDSSRGSQQWNCQISDVLLLWAVELFFCREQVQWFSTPLIVFFFVLTGFHVILILFYYVFQTCFLRYQLNISYDPWSRNNKIVCGLQRFRGEHKFICKFGLWGVTSSPHIAKFNHTVYLCYWVCEQDLLRDKGNFTVIGRTKFCLLHVNHETMTFDGIKICCI